MTEMQSALRMLAGNFPTAIQQINYPMHKGQPNPAHGKFIFVGKQYDAAGAERIQGVDCRWIKR